MNPLAEQTAPPQPQGAVQGNNPLASLAGPLPGLPSRLPAPTAAQATAAVKRFGAVADAMRTVLANPDLGRKNVRPAIMDQASRLMAARVLSLPEVMQAIGKVGDDPLAQKQQVQQIFAQAQQAESAVLAHHSAAVAMGLTPRSGGPKYRSEDHDDHIAGLLAHYPNQKA